VAGERIVTMPGLPTIESYHLPKISDLPRNKAQWRLDPQRALLLVHDMQTYFLDPFEEGFRRVIVENTVTVSERCRGSGITVAYTAQPGSMTETDRGLLKDFWGTGMRATPSEKAIVPPLKPHMDDWELTKWRYSAFTRTSLFEKMREGNIDQMILCGVYASVGILTTALDAYCRDIQVFVVADAVGDFNRHDHYSTIAYISNHCGISVCAEQVLQ
jgi:isochorismate hydrolase